MNTNVTKTYSARSHRVEINPERSPTHVRYNGAVAGADRAAQLADVSVSGMRLISRAPAKANVGDFISVEFTLPGSERTIKRQARVVRKINDFVFAARFIAVDERENATLEVAIEKHVSHSRNSSYFGSFKRAWHWVRDHRQGLLASILALVVLGGAGAYILVNSDEQQGKELRSWGREMPKEWYWDYIRNFTQRDSK